jgi:GNAT superfamily N-acetyltransferase
MDLSPPAAPQQVWVTYLELREAPARAASRSGPERLCLEEMTGADYLDLYRRVGEPLRWDTRLKMPGGELESLLAGGSLHIYVLRAGEVDGGSRPGPALKHFGLVPEAQGRGLGPWLLSTALCGEWAAGAKRIWLHTDTWDHPAALPVYRRAGFKVYDARYQAAEGL